MDNPNKESLEKLLHLIDELCQIEGNKWFEEKLKNKFSKGYNFENFPEFLKAQKLQFKIKGRSFYSSIKDKKLKKELIDDYIEMSWYQTVNDVSRFILFCFYQMENMLNSYISISNAYEKIKVNKDYYSYSYSEKFSFVPYDRFFYKKFKNNVNEEYKNPIEKIDIWSKITFWMIDAKLQDWEKENHWNISNMINIRNANSHRNSSIQNNKLGEEIKKLKSSDFSRLGFYINILRKIIESFKKIDPKVKKYDVVTKRPKLEGPKFSGEKIDLDKYNRK